MRSLELEKHGKTSMIDRMIRNKWTGVVVRLDSQRVVHRSYKGAAALIKPQLADHTKE